MRPDSSLRYRRYINHLLTYLLTYLLSFFPRLISAVADWMSTVLLHMVWL